jgi:hypothetical protein
MEQLAKFHEVRAAFKKTVELAPDGQGIKEASILT